MRSSKRCVAQSPQWRFISMDDEDLGDGVAGFRALFGDLDEPFARLYKALSNRVDLFVGIPAGPLHFTMARGGIPTVGLWIAHHPDWYDEPNPQRSISSDDTSAIARSNGGLRRRPSRPRSGTAWSISTRAQSPPKP